MAPSERVQGWRAGAQAGRAEDQYRLGTCYYHGTDGLAVNKWWAVQVDPRGLTALGFIV